jgi:hypothetical protein
MEKLYALIWPMGRFQGNLAEAVARTTEKGAGDAGPTALFLVNAAKRHARAWEDGANAVEPIVSPDGGRLFFRRGRTIWQQGLEVGKDGPRSLGKPEALGGIEVRRLYACMAVNGAGYLWAETKEGQIRQVRWDRQPADWADLPADDRFTQTGPRPTAEMLQRLRSLRPDGLQAWVRDHKLVGQRGDRDPIENLAPISATGVPAWIGNSEWLLVTASVEE